MSLAEEMDTVTGESAGSVRGNTNAPTIMIAERAPDLIRGRPVGPELAAAP